MKKTIALLFGSAAICSSAAIQPAVAFRFDDNHKVEHWEALADVFRKNDVRFSCSIIPMFGEGKDPAWCQEICKLESEGFEIMDHTPQHTTNTVTFSPDDPRLEKLAKEPFVDHITGGKVCLKYTVGASIFSKPFTVKIFDKNKITSTTKLARRMNIEIDGKHYYLTPAGKENVFKLVTIWQENDVNMPDGEKTVRRIIKERVELADGGCEFLIQCSQEAFRKIGLKKMPSVWIQPGGYYPHLGIEKLSTALRKYNYVSASCQQNASIKGFADPEFEDRRFSMLWGNFNLEKFDLQLQKTRIADTLACRKVAIGSSHLTPVRRDGKLKEYMAMYEQLLPWLKANNIKVMTQGEITAHLQNTKVDPNENIMPSLANDIDGNNIPDGYSIKKSCKWNKSEKAIQLKGKGLLLYVKELCGLPRNKVKFSLEAKGDLKGNVIIELIDSLKKDCGKVKLELKNSADWQKYEIEFVIPEKCAALNLLLTSEKADCTVRNLDLRAVK